MIYGETGRLDSFDPFTIHEASGQRLAELLFDSLVEVGPGGEWMPALAKSWSVAKSGTEVLFTLRGDVVWHQADEKSPSVMFGPEDVVTTVRLLKSATSEIPNKERFSALVMAEVAGKDKVLIRLNRASVDPLRSMLFKVLPKHVVGGSSGLKRDSEFARRPIGTGPYAFVQANAQGEVQLKANIRYYRGRPQIPGIILKTYADQTIMAQSLMFNALDLVTWVSPRDLGEILGDRRLSVVPYDALSFSFFAFNTSRGILQDKRVRQAISWAINRQEMLEAFFQGKGRLISGPFPPTSWAYNLDVPSIPYDIKRANDLLSAAGLKIGSDGSLLDQKGKPVVLVFAVPLAGESEMIKRVVLALQGYLGKIGLKVELQFMDWLVWKKKVLAEHDYDMTIASWSFDDASNITSLFHSSSAEPWGNNFVLYRNKSVDALLTEADATNDFDKRRAIYHKLHSVLADEAPYAWLWTLVHHAAHHSRLTGVKVEPFAFFKHVTAWNLEASRDGKK
jgi:peptide/nickel transport system substrate-binding protein